jgi:hypothetical protein
LTAGRVHSRRRRLDCRANDRGRTNRPARLRLLYGIDPLEAVPLEHFRTTTALHKVRWPQILAEVTRKRESMRKLQPMR